MFASRWHSPPKPASVFSCVDRHVQRRQPVGVHASPPRRPRARRRARPRRSASTRSSSVVLPAPGALMKFTTRTPARSKSSRLARAIVLLASSASSTTLTLVRCIAAYIVLDLQVPLDLGQLATATAQRRARRARPSSTRPSSRLDLPRGDHELLEQLATSRSAASSAARTGSAQLDHDLLLVAGHAASAGSQPTTSIRAGDCAELAGQREHLHRVHAVRVEPRPRRARQLGLDQEQRAGRLAARRRRRRTPRRRSPRRSAYTRSIPRMPKSTTSTPAAARAARGGRATATPKPSSPRKMLPIPATSTRGGAAWSPAERLDLLGREEEPVPGLARLAEVAAGVVVDVTASWTRPSRSCWMPSTIATRPSIARSNTSPPARGRSTHAAAAPDLDAGRPSTAVRARAARAPPSAGPLAHRAIPKSRTAPCRLISSLRRERLGALEDLRARAGRTRASRPSPRRSALRMFSTSIWSISPPSNRSPGLSGAIARVVLQDDRRGEHACCGRPARRRAPATRPRCGRPSACSRSSLGRVGERDERAAAGAQHGVARAEACARSASSRVAAGHGVVFAIRTVTPVQRRPRRVARPPPSSEPSSARQLRDARAAPRRAAPPRAPRGDLDRQPSPAPGAELALGRLLPGDVALAVDRQLVHRLAVARAPGARTTCRKRTRTSTVGRGRPRAGTGPHRPAVVGVAPRCAPRGYTPPKVQRCWFFSAERR